MRRLVIATTILVCLFAASNAAAAKRAPRGFYGVIAAEGPSGAEFSKMGAGKVGTVRIIMSWAEVQTASPAAFDWSHYDSIVGQAAQQGIRILPTVYGSPSWAAAAPNNPPTSGNLDEFQAFSKAAAQRYGANGIFWTLNPLVPKLPITDWQLWNEVNSPSFWGPHPDAAQYKPLLEAFHAGIKSGDPSGRIMLAGLFRTPRIAGGVRATKYLEKLYKLKARGLFDSVAVHPYATNPKRALQSVEEARDVMRRFKDKKKPIWLTEVGWSTGGQRTPLTVKPKTQAKYLKDTYKTMAANRKKMKIGGVIWYSLRDVGGSTWFNHTGLFNENGSAKPAWFAFVGQTGGRP